ncbi:Zinc finger fyve domain-containing protein 16, partial [Globisporangium splendens]
MEFDSTPRPRRNTDIDSVRNSNVFRRMSGNAMGLEANALCHRSHWVPKSTRSSCSNCKRAFRLWTKKHHCRFCGEVVCRNCSTQRILIQKKTLRSCDACVSVNVMSISELSRRNSASDVSKSDVGPRHSLGGRKSDGALLRKSALKGSKKQRTTRLVQRGDALYLMRSRWRSQLPYVVVVFVLTLAGVANLLTRM